VENRYEQWKVDTLWQSEHKKLWSRQTSNISRKTQTLRKEGSVLHLVGYQERDLLWVVGTVKPSKTVTVMYQRQLIRLSQELERGRLYTGERERPVKLLHDSRPHIASKRKKHHNERFIAPEIFETLRQRLWITTSGRCNTPCPITFNESKNG